jgi:7-carboxy-7-deazaguanine synthase
MRISELFHSIQGEGKLTGMPSVFVRASGCNLRCTWCDTPYASWHPEGDDWPISRIVDEVARFSCRHVVLTGGEPVIMPDIAELCDALRARQHHLTIETAATVFKPLPIDLASLSPKLSNSTPHELEGGKFAVVHERQRLNVEAIRQFIETSTDYQLKFVVAQPSDLDEIDALLAQLPAVEPANVLLMPEGTTAEALQGRAGWLAELCKSRGFRFCHRLHVELYGNRRGT